MNAGISFSPLGQPGGNGQSGNQQQQGSAPGVPVQDAIRLLSLKLPSVLGPTAGSPLAFGTPSPLGPQLGTAMAQNWLRGLFSPSTPVQQGGTPASPMGKQGGQGSPDIASLFQQLLSQIGAPNFLQQSPGQTPAAGKPTVQFPAQRPPEPTYGDTGGAQRTIGPAMPINRMGTDSGNPFGGGGMDFANAQQ